MKTTYAILAVVIVCLAAGASAAVLPPWGQCGGLSGVCGQSGKGPCVDAVWSDPVCPADFKCSKDSQWYYQCTPTSTPVAPPVVPPATEESSAAEASTSTETSSAAPVTPPAGSDLAPWAQCGGKGAACGQAGQGPCEDAAWAGMQCSHGYSCVKLNDYYYQCQPAKQ